MVCRMMCVMVILKDTSQKIPLSSTKIEHQQERKHIGGRELNITVIINIVAPQNTSVCGEGKQNIHNRINANENIAYLLILSSIRGHSINVRTKKMKYLIYGHTT